MKLLGTTMHGHSHFDDRLWGLLGGFADDVDPTRPRNLPSHPIFDGVDMIGMVPFMVLAGASVRSEWLPEGDMVQIFIEVAENEEERFYAQLERDLIEARAFEA